MKTNCLILLLLVLMSYFMMGCGEVREEKYKITYLGLRSQKSGEYVLMSADGELLEAGAHVNTCELDDVNKSSVLKYDDIVSPVVNGYYTVKHNKEYQLYKLENGEINNVEIGLGVYEIGFMSDGLIPMSNYDGTIKVRDENGALSFTLDTICGECVNLCKNFSCGALVVGLENGTYTYVDKSGNRLFDRIYRSCTDFDQNMAIISKEDDKYILIDITGKKYFEFESDTDEIIFSPQYERLTAEKAEGGWMIYDFQGNVLCECPEKVRGILTLCEECFVFRGSSGNLGLMSYEGKELIMAKYEEIVPNGDYFFAINDNYDGEVWLIDKNDNKIRTYDGEEIVSFGKSGFDYPIIIRRSDDEMYLVDDIGQVLGKGPVCYDTYDEDMEHNQTVNNLYFPVNEILSTVMGLCGLGDSPSAVDKDVYFKEGTHCTPERVSFIRRDIRESDLRLYGSNYRVDIIEEKCYELTFTAHFDIPIVWSNSWLTSVELSFKTDSSSISDVFYNKCASKFVEYGCEELEHSDSKMVFVNYEDNKQITMRKNNRREFSITINKYKNNNNYDSISIDKDSY